MRTMSLVAVLLAIAGPLRAQGSAADVEAWRRALAELAVVVGNAGMPPSVLCVGVVTSARGRAREVRPEVLAGLDDWGGRVSYSSLEHCPTTYDRMFTVVESLGRPVGPARPPGHTDPFVLTLEPPVQTVRRAIIVRVEVHQGTRGTLYLCERNRCQRVGDHVH